MMMSVDDARYEQIDHLLHCDKWMTVEDIFYKVAGRREWRKGTSTSTGTCWGDPMPEASIKKKIVEILGRHPREFVRGEHRGQSLWRRRYWMHCSFCWKEGFAGTNLYSAVFQGAHIAVFQGAHICRKCAEVAVQHLSKLDERDAQANANECAILSGKEILGA
jgi:hypothetical protein